MQYRSLKGFSGVGQAGILLALIGAGIILAAFGQMFILNLLDGTGSLSTMSPDALTNTLLKPENANYVRLMNAVGTFCLMFLPSVLFSYIVHGKSWIWMGFSKWFNVQQLIIGFALIFFANLLAVPFAEMSKSIVANFPDLNVLATELETTYEKQVKVISNLSTLNEFFLALVFVALLPALFEELFFRSTIQTMFERWWKKPILAIIVTSIIFSLIHLSIYLFISRIVLGIILGLLYYRTKNVWVSTFVHFANNALAVAQMYYYSGNNLEVPISEMDPAIPWWAVIPTLLLIVGGFFLLEKYSVKNRARIHEREQELLAQPNSLNPFK